MSNILKFIGIEEKHIISSILKANEGNFVMKNLDGYRIAQQISEIQYFITHPFAEEKEVGGGTMLSDLWNLKGNSEKLIS